MCRQSRSSQDCKMLKFSCILTSHMPQSPRDFQFQYKLVFWCFSIYSRFSLSWLLLSRITTYLEVKIMSLSEHETLKTGNKILWKSGEIAPLEQFLLFPTIFSLYLQESNYIFICEVWLFYLFFPEFCKSIMSRYRYLVVSESILRTSEITRVHCISSKI